MPGDPIHHYARLLLANVPDEIRKSISSEELNDRLVEAARASAQATDPALSADVRKMARRRGLAVLRAQPRDVTERQHRELIAKAAAAQNPFHADAIRRAAERLIEEEHPVAPRRGAAVAKAGKAGKEPPVPVFDADGNLVGVVEADEIMPVAGAGKKTGAAQDTADQPAGQAAAQAPADGQQPVAKAWRTTVYDQRGRAYVADRRNIRPLAGGAVRKAADDLVTLYDSAGRAYQVDRSAVQPADAQARSTGPVRAGGTTGMGKPRVTGPGAALPGDGPQRAMPGDMAGRTVVKAAGWTDVHDWTGSLVGVVKQADLVRTRPETHDRVVKSRAADVANVYDRHGRRIGFAPLAAILPVRRGR